MKKKIIPKQTYKIMKSWYFEAENIMELKKDKLATMRTNPDEIVIIKCNNS